MVENAVHAQEVDEQGSGYPLVAIAEGMVLDDKVQEVRSLFLHARIEFLTAEGLVDGTECALESLILFQTEQTIEIPLHGVDDANPLVVTDDVQCLAVVPSMASVPWS